MVPPDDGLDTGWVRCVGLVSIGCFLEESITGAAILADFSFRIDIDIQRDRHSGVCGVLELHLCRCTEGLHVSIASSWVDESNGAVVRSPSGETFVAPAQSPSPANNATLRMKILTPPVDTAELDDQVPSRLVTLLVSVRSPCAMTDVERRAVIARGMRVNMVIRVGGW